MAKFTNNIFYHVNISHLFHNLLNFSDAKVKKYILRYTHSNIPRNKRKIAIQKKPTQYLYILCVSHWSENTQFTQRNPGTDMIFTFRILGFFCFELGLMIYIRRKVTTSSWYGTLWTKGWTDKAFWRDSTKEESFSGGQRAVQRHLSDHSEDNLATSISSRKRGKLNEKRRI